MEQKNIVAVDIGHSYTKVAWRNPGHSSLNFSKFPSAVMPKFSFVKKELRPNGFDLILSGDMHREKFSGDSILTLGSEELLTPNLDELFPLSELYQDLLTASLARQPHDVIDTLVLSLPLRNFPKMSLFLKKRFATEMTVTQDRKVRVVSIDVMAQGAGPAIEFLSSQNEYFVCFDLGWSALNIFPVAKGEFIASKCEAVQFGMNDLVSEILSSQAIHNTEPRSDILKSKINQVLYSGCSANFAAKVFTFNQLLSLAPLALEQMSNLILAKAPPSTKLLLSGGGSLTLKQILKNRYVDFLRIWSADLSNVEGMLRNSS
jgi:hypothetical protein